MELPQLQRQNAYIEEGPSQMFMDRGFVNITTTIINLLHELDPDCGIVENSIRTATLTPVLIPNTHDTAYYVAQAIPVAGCRNTWLTTIYLYVIPYENLPIIHINDYYRDTIFTTIQYEESIHIPQGLQITGDNSFTINPRTYRIVMSEHPLNIQVIA